MPDENGNPTAEELQQQVAQLMETNRQQNLLIWRSKAADQNATLKGFTDLLTGETEEEVMASAKQLAERFSQSFQQPTPPTPPTQEPTAQQLYGQPGSGGNGLPLEQPNPLLDLENRVRSNMPRGADVTSPNTGVGRGEAKVSKQDAARFQTAFFQRFGRDMLISHGKMRPMPGEVWRHTETGQVHTG